MSIKIAINPPEDNVKSHLSRLKIFKAELNILRSMFYNRLRSIQQVEQEFFEKNNLPKPVLDIQQLSGEETDPESNLYFKSFLFIYRQYIEKVLRIIYLLKDKYENKKAKITICDASQSDKFRKFIENLLADNYEYDDEIISTLKKHSDALILSRLMRNSLKLQGTFNVLFINGDVRIICPLLAKDKKDKTLPLLKTKFSTPFNEMRNLTMNPGILDLFVNSTDDLLNVLEKKTASIDD